MDKNNLDIKIFIGTPANPADGKWVNLNKTDHNELANTFNNSNLEYLISDIDSNFNLPSESSISFYLQMQNLINQLNNDSNEDGLFLLAYANEIKGTTIFDDINELNEYLNTFNVKRYNDNSNNKKDFISKDEIKTDYIIDLINSDFFGEDIKSVYENNSSYIDYLAMFDSLEYDYEFHIFQNYDTGAFYIITDLVA